jgi:hypothetical protein
MSSLLGGSLHPSPLSHFVLIFEATSLGPTSIMHHVCGKPTTAFFY